MDTILKVIVSVVAAVFAYGAVATERRSRAWTPTVTIAVFLTLFGGASAGLLNVESYYSAKLSDKLPSATDLLIGGIIVIASIVILALDLLGKIDVMSQIRRAVNGSDKVEGSGPGPTPSKF